ncbi:MAG TPA: Hsp33 family molecular chaperone HslO [Alphaproteobacteria bacterium]|nr:Hsp33 family molecular chaperone HslO [Alphaproteobacteria bacterium]
MTKDTTKDAIVPFYVLSNQVRGRMVDLSEVSFEILAPHNYPPAVNYALLELMALTAALLNCFKFEGQFTVQISADGPIRMLVVDMTSDAKMRACATFDKEAVVALDPHKISVQDLFKSGYLAFTIDPGREGMDRYQGVVALEGETLSDCLNHFFRQSEQLETAFKVTQMEHTVRCLMLQRLALDPNTTEVEKDLAREEWVHAMAVLGTVKNSELLQDDAATLTRKLFWEKGVVVNPSIPIHSYCRCSHDRLLETLKTFKQENLMPLAKNGVIDAVCDFCSKKYTYNLLDLIAPEGGKQ